MNIFKLCFRLFVITLCCVAMGNWTSCLLWQCFLITLSVTQSYVPPANSRPCKFPLSPPQSHSYLKVLVLKTHLYFFVSAFIFLIFWFTFCRCTVFTAQNECDFFLIKEIYITWRPTSALVFWQVWFFLGGGGDRPSPSHPPNYQSNQTGQHLSHSYIAMSQKIKWLKIKV